MKSARTKCVLHLIAAFALLYSGNLTAQCPEVYDFNGNPSYAPYWYNCNGNAFDLNLQSPDDWGEYEIDWGDGSPVTTGTSWDTPDMITHNYAAVVDTFVVTITEVNTGCVIEGVVVQEEATSASIQVPVGGLTQACAPELMEFINSSTNVSETTNFMWQFGDGSPPLYADHTNWNQVVSHIYQAGTVDCETQVTLTAENYCNTVQGGPSVATFSPIRIWDIDDAAITPSDLVLCYPDTTFIFENTTERNCLFQGNIFQRYEYWNFGDYWGQGTDSIIDWTPWPPSQDREVAFPGVGTYEVMLVDSNYCGVDTATIEVEIVPPPQAEISQSTDTICVGDPVTFFNDYENVNPTDLTYEFQWNFDDGLGWLPTGQGNITYVFNNPGTYNVCNTINIANSNDVCRDTACVELTVLPAPIAEFDASALTGCDSLDVSFTDQSTGAMGWEWTFPSGTYSGQNPPDQFFDSPGDYVVTLTVEGLNGCLDTYQELIHVYESPNADYVIDNVCEGSESVLTDLSTSDPGDPIISWEWGFGDGDVDYGQNTTHVYDSQGTYDVTLTVSTATCSDSYTMSVDVGDSPVPNVTPVPAEGCAPLEVYFDNNTTGADSYTWQFGGGASSSEEDPTHTFDNPSAQDSIYNVVMIATTAFGCSITDTIPVTVYPGAQASFTDNSAPPGCSPFDGEFTNTSTGATSYLWDFGDGSPTTTEESPDHTFTNNTGFLATYTVTLIAYANNGCHDTTSTEVTVYPLPDFSFDITPGEQCSPAVVTFPFIQGAQTFEWDFGDGSPISNASTPTHVYENNTLNPVTYEATVIATSGFGCTDTASSTIQINPSPVAQFTSDIQQGCAPLTVEFENLSLGADSYTWNYDDGQTSDTLANVHSHTFENTTGDVQTFVVTLQAETVNGCLEEYTEVIEVYPEPVADFTPPDTGCSPYTPTFINNSLNADSYYWEFGNGITSISENPSTTFVNNSGTDTTYSACLTIETNYGCVDQVCHDIVVQTAPSIDFSADQSEGCSTMPITFTNNTLFGDTYEWDYGDGNQSTTDETVHTHDFENFTGAPSTFDVTLTATSASGCIASDDIPVTIYPEVTADFTGPADGCAPLTANFTNQSVNGNAGYEWDFGNGFVSSQENPSSTFINTSNVADTTYNVTLITNSIYGCTDTITQPIVVHPTPVADVEIDTLIGCYPLDVTFLNNSVGGDTYQWVYGTGETGDTTAVSHTYTYYNNAQNPVNYNVTLNVYTIHGCQSQDQTTVNVLPALNADFDAPDGGCSPLNIDFENESVGGLTYSWEFGDGNMSTAENPSYQYINETLDPETYTVTLTVESYFGCEETITKDIDVYPVPVADFEATPANQVFPDATVDLVNLSTGADLMYEWDMDDGTTLTDEDPGSHTYNTWGEYQINLFIDNGYCDASTQRTIVIDAPTPIADFDGPQAGCAPLTVSFTDQSEWAADYQWTFGDGGSATVSDPVYTFYQPGTYTVTLTVTGFDGQQTDQITQEQIIEVYPNAQAAFTVTPNQVSVPSQPVYMLNLSNNATSYFWDFGDGNSSTDENPDHQYTEPGAYTITLTAENQWGCNDTFSITEAVTAISDGQINFPNAFTPSANGPNDGDYDPNALDNNIFFPIQKGVQEYQLLIFNRWGELLFQTDNVNRGWDGYYQGELCKQDVYVWKVRAKFSDGREIEEAGDVTLLR
ncbi:PKD domain-containing protein [Halocola ammonii]